MVPLDVIHSNILASLVLYSFYIQVAFTYLQNTSDDSPSASLSQARPWGVCSPATDSRREQGGRGGGGVGEGGDTWGSSLSFTCWVRPPADSRNKKEGFLLLTGSSHLAFRIIPRLLVLPRSSWQVATDFRQIWVPGTQSAEPVSPANFSNGVCCWLPYTVSCERLFFFLFFFLEKALVFATWVTYGHMDSHTWMVPFNRPPSILSLFGAEEVLISG